MNARITRIETRKIPAIGTCEVCGKKDVELSRTYFYYDDIQCECHSPQHFDLIEHCETCKPNQPHETKITLKTFTSNTVAKPNAVDVIRDLSILLQDIEYKESWVANIAMSYIDNENWYRSENNKNKELLNYEDRHAIANLSAKHFINLITKPNINKDPIEQILDNVQPTLDKLEQLTKQKK